MTLQEAIAIYIEVMQVRHYARKTIINRNYQLRCLSRFMAQQEPPVNEIEIITGELLMEFQSWFYHLPTWRGTVRGVSNQNRVIAGVRRFFEFLKLAGYLHRNPSEVLEFGREPDTLPRAVLTMQEARRIIEVVDTQTPIGYRDRTILEVFYATGIRKHEMLQLRVRDVNLEEELLRVERGKGGRDRIVPLSHVACRFLENYINAIRPQLAAAATKYVKKTDRLFLTPCGRAIEKNALSEVVVKYAQMAKIKKRVTCHVWRHSCATHLLKNRANLRHVQEILGHRSLATTERYLHLTITDLKEAHRKYHPREKGVD